MIASRACATSAIVFLDNVLCATSVVFCHQFKVDTCSLCGAPSAPHNPPPNPPQAGGSSMRRPARHDVKNSQKKSPIRIKTPRVGSPQGTNFSHDIGVGKKTGDFPGQPRSVFKISPTSIWARKYPKGPLNHRKKDPLRTPTSRTTSGSAKKNMRFL
jgi:hypothetical protein